MGDEVFGNPCSSLLLDIPGGELLLGICNKEFRGVGGRFYQKVRKYIEAVTFDPAHPYQRIAGVTIPA